MAGLTKKELEIILRLKDQASAGLEKVGNEAEVVGRKAKKGTDEADRGLKKVKKSSESLGASFKKMLIPLAAIGGVIATLGLVRFAKEMSEAASAAEELQSKFEAVFKDSAPEMERFVDELAVTLSRGRLQIKGMVADMKPFFDGMGFAAEASEAFSKRITKLAVDWASFTNQDDVETLQLMRSALVGNAEALDRFGARFNAAAVEVEAARLGFGGVTGELTEQEKVMARLSLMFQKLPDAIGDAERTAGSFQNRMKSLKGEIADMRAEFGERLNKAILEGFDTAGGVDKVLGLVRVFHAAIAEFSRIGVSLAADLAGQAAAALEQFGGPEGFIHEMQRRGDILVASIKVTAFEIRGVVLAFALGMQRIAALAGKFIDLGSPVGLEAELQAKAFGLGLIDRQSGLNAAGKAELQQTLSLLDLVKSMRENEEAIARAKEAGAEAAERTVQWTQADLDRFQSGIAGAFGGGHGSGASSGSVMTPEATAELAALEEELKKFHEVAPGIEATADAVRDLTDAVKEYSAAERFADRQTAQMADAFLGVATGATKAEDALKQFFRSFIHDLFRLQAQSAFKSLFGGAFEGIFSVANPVAAAPAPVALAGGGIVPSGGGWMPMKGYASGGPIFNTPHMAVIGEGRMKEAAVPLPDGRSIPVTLKGGGGVSIAVHINANDSRSVNETIAGDPEGFASNIMRAMVTNRDLRAILSGQER